MPRMTGGDAIVDSILRHGIDTIFGRPPAFTVVPGPGVMNTMAR